MTKEDQNAVIDLAVYHDRLADRLMSEEIGGQAVTFLVGEIVV